MAGHELGLALQSCPGDAALTACPTPRQPTRRCTKSPAFRGESERPHPSIDETGLVLHESRAIQPLSRKKNCGRSRLPTSPRDGEMGMWALWAANEVGRMRQRA